MYNNQENPNFHFPGPLSGPPSFPFFGLNYPAVVFPAFSHGLPRYEYQNPSRPKRRNPNQIGLPCKKRYKKNAQKAKQPKLKQKAEKPQPSDNGGMHDLWLKSIIFATGTPGLDNQHEFITARIAGHPGLDCFPKVRVGDSKFCFELQIALDKKDRLKFYRRSKGGLCRWKIEKDDVACCRAFNWSGQVVNPGPQTWAEAPAGKFEPVERDPLPVETESVPAVIETEQEQEAQRSFFVVMALKRALTELKIDELLVPGSVPSNARLLIMEFHPEIQQNKKHLGEAYRGIWLDCLEASTFLGVEKKDTWAVYGQDQFENTITRLIQERDQFLEDENVKQKDVILKECVRTLQIEKFELTKKVGALESENQKLKVALKNFFDLAEQAKELRNELTDTA